MGRIRSIKPEFFKDAELYDAEVESGLPLRVAFAGLWCQADREGRFRWKPRELKTEVLPYDSVDFSRVLDALTTRGWVLRYRVGTREFGQIRTFREHQYVNPKERASILPSIEEADEFPEESTREPRVTDASPRVPIKIGVEGEGKGNGVREGEGKGTGPSSTDSSATADGDAPGKPPSKRSGDVQAVADHYRGLHPQARPGVKERALIAARLREGYSVEDLCAAIDGFHRSPWHTGENPGGKVYLSLKLLMRDSSQVAAGLEHASGAGATGKSEAETRNQRVLDDWHVGGLASAFGSTDVEDVTYEVQ